MMNKLFSYKMMVGLIVSCSLFMDALDTTILNTAIPVMSRSLHVNVIDLKIALISYLINLAIFMPISGWVADKFGIKKVFIAAIALFTISSFFCGYANSLWELVIARSFQGIGGSFMLPLGRLIILHTFPRHEMVNAMNYVIMIVSVGLMLGPLAGGMIVDHYTWSWIFWVNIPVGFMTVIMSIFWLQDTSHRNPRPLDLVGFLLLGGGLAGLTFSMSDLSESTASTSNAFKVMSLSIIMLIAYFFQSRKKTHPILNLQLFRHRTFQVSILANLLSRLSFGGVPYLLPLLLQVGLGYSAQLSGLLMVPMAVGILLIKNFSLPILRLAGFKRVLIINTFFVAAALWIFQAIDQQTPVILIACLTFLFGFLIAMQYSSMNSLCYADLSRDEFSSATSIISMTQQLSQSFGVAVAAMLLYFYSYLYAHPTVLTPVIFHRAFFALGWLTFISIIMFIRIKPNDGHQMLFAPKQPTDQVAP